MALLHRRAGRVPPATTPFHHAFNFATELSAWAPVIALLSLAAIAALILLLRVSGY